MPRSASADTQGPAAWRRRLLLAGKVAVSAGILWYLLDRETLEAIAAHLAGARPGWLAAALAVLTVQLAAAAVRWRAVLDRLHGPTPLARTLHITWIGAFFNQALPSAIGGDLVRAWLVCRAGVPALTSVSSVLVDRLSALVVTVLAVALGAPAVFAMAGGAALGWSLVAVAAAGAAGVAGLLVLGRVRWRILALRVLRELHVIAADARRVLLPARSAATVLLLSAAMLLMSCAAVWLLSKSLRMDLEPLACLVLVPPVILVTILPVSIAGWGVRELAMVTAFGLAGVPETQALGLSFAFGVGLLAVGLPGGLLWLVRGRQRAEPAVGA